MAKRRSLFSRLVDTRVDRWMSWDYLAENSLRIKNSLADIVIPEKAKYKETFEEAMIRLNLTEEDLKKRKTEFARLFYLFLALGILIIFYAIYMASIGYFGATLISFCLSGFALAHAFKWHFWLFQIRHRKLGCSIKEWLNGKVMEEPSSHALATKPQQPSSLKKGK